MSFWNRLFSIDSIFPLTFDPVLNNENSVFENANFRRKLQSIYKLLTEQIAPRTHIISGLRFCNNVTGKKKPFLT